MKIHHFADYLNKLEQTSKRLEITTILADLIKNLDDTEIYEGTHLSLGQLKAKFENPKFNIADKLMIKILDSSYGKVAAATLYAQKGDLGDVAYQMAPEAKSSLTLIEAYQHLIEIADVAGSGSQDLKIKKTAALLNKLDQLSAKFIVRIILGTTRLGFTELTVIAALAESLGDKATLPPGGLKKLTEQIEATYSLHPDIGLIAKTIKAKGLKGLDKIKMEPGIPVLVQKCQRLGTDTHEIIEKMGKIWTEFKYDGTRVEAHMDRSKKPDIKTAEQVSIFEDSTVLPKFLIKTFTRNEEETTHQYPDINEAMDKQIDAQSVILDGEAVGYNKETGQFLPFQEMMQRKRKHDIAEMVKTIPLKYYVFDILYLNGESQINKPLTERKKLLEKIIKKGDVIESGTYNQVETAEQLDENFAEAQEKSLEGLILKKPDAPYQAGARAYTWVKLKNADQKLLDDTVEVVVLGYYFGKGTRTKFGIGGFLVGTYDRAEGVFKTFTKVGTGLTDEQWVELKNRADKVKTTEKPTNVIVNKLYEPSVWLLPKVVVEIGGDEISKSQTHSAGYALRFPRLIKFRDDKKPTDITDLDEIKSLHNSQKRGYY